MEKIRVLIIDDEEAVGKLLQISLDLSGRYEATYEPDPLRALDVARRVRPDVLIIDVLMPGLQGGELAARIRAEPELAAVPILFLTATLSREDAGLKLSASGEAYEVVAKPVRPRELMEVIDRVVGSGAAAGALSSRLTSR